MTPQIKQITDKLLMTGWNKTSMNRSQMFGSDVTNPRPTNYVDVLAQLKNGGLSNEEIDKHMDDSGKVIYRFVPDHHFIYGLDQEIKIYEASNTVEFIFGQQVKGNPILPISQLISVFHMYRGKTMKIDLFHKLLVIRKYPIEHIARSFDN